MAGDDAGLSIMRAITIARNVPGTQIKSDDHHRDTSDLPMAPKNVVQSASRLCDDMTVLEAHGVAMKVERAMWKKIG